MSSCRGISMAMTPTPFRAGSEASADREGSCHDELWKVAVGCRCRCGRELGRLGRGQEYRKGRPRAWTCSSGGAGQGRALVGAAARTRSSQSLSSSSSSIKGSAWPGSTVSFCGARVVQGSFVKGRGITHPGDVRARELGVSVHCGSRFLLP